MLADHSLETERTQKSKETGDSRYIYQNKLDQACFQHDTDYGYFKDLPRRKTSDKVLRYKAFNIAKNPKHDGYQRGPPSMVYDFLDKKSSDVANNFEPTISRRITQTNY